MENEIKCCVITDAHEKQEMVVCFSDFTYRKDLDKKDIVELSRKIAEHAAVITAVINNEKAGLISYYRNDLKSKTAFINLVVVNPKKRGMGVATAMLKKVVEDCADNGFRQIRLEVDSDNKKAIHLYEKAGFKKEDETSDGKTFYKLIL